MTPAALHPGLRITAVDPRSPEALALLREAAMEARQLYADQIRPDAPWPTNPPALPRSVYLLAWRDGEAVGCGALQPLSGDSTDSGAPDTAEVRRIFVKAGARRGGVAAALMAALEAEARSLGYRRLRLETGERQQPAIRLYEASGYRRIPPFGAYQGDPTSVCFERLLG